MRSGHFSMRKGRENVQRTQETVIKRKEMKAGATQSQVNESKEKALPVTAVITFPRAFVWSLLAPHAAPCRLRSRFSSPHSALESVDPQAPVRSAIRCSSPTFNNYFMPLLSRIQVGYFLRVGLRQPLVKPLP